jgi:acetyl-CoA carboxylase carboxyltransferase component
MSIEDKMADLAKRNEKAVEAGGKDKIDKQHSSGRLTARERVDYLIDKGTFQELDRFKVHRCHDFGMEKKKYPGDGVVTGYGMIDGRMAYVYSMDFTVLGGSLSGALSEKICKVMDLAMRNGAPVIGINDSGGARIQEGVFSLGGYGDIFLRNTLASGVVPQITSIMGPAAGGGVYSPAMTDFIFMVDKTSYMFITGPQVIKAATHEIVSEEELGGAMTHNATSGVAHFMGADEYDTLDQIKTLLSYLPSNNLEDPPFVDTGDDPNRVEEGLNYIVPDDPQKAYDIRDIINNVMDRGTFFEVHKYFAANMVVGFARLGGHSVGIIANQPAVLAGCIDINASVKCARFVRFCDAFNIPTITFVDVPGFLPGTQQEYGGIIKHGCKIIYAYSEATVPKITLITRKAYGGAYVAMSSKHLRTDLNFAYPTAEIAVMGPEGAVNIVFRNEIKKAEEKEERRQELIQDYRNLFASPYKAAEQGFIDEVIEPQYTRPKLVMALNSLKNKRDTSPPKKHGNINL